MKALLWVNLFLVLYVYVGYPLLLRLLVILRGRKEAARGDGEPKVTLIISAYNEEAVIGEKVANSLALDYPRGKLEVMVVSDCSSDRTDDIVRGFAARDVVLRRMSGRRGKTRGLNDAVPHASGAVMVFSDANALYRPDAIRKLVRNFNDPAVGCVIGESRYVGAKESLVGRQEGAYWDYERSMKIDETSLGSMVGADGAIFALRKSLYEPLEETDINDFVTPLQVVMKGYRCVYEPEAICDERGTARYGEEFRRKTRIVNRSAYALRKMGGLLNPFRYGWFSLQLASHKILRWAVPLWLAALFVASVSLADESTMYRYLLYGQLAFYLLAAAGAWLPGIRAPGSYLLTIPYYFCMVNAAAILGLAKALRGRVQVTWTPERGHDPSTTSPRATESTGPV